jgi:uncharacterized protein (DUF2336 family)
MSVQALKSLLQDAVRLARHGDAAARTEVAGGAATPPELLTYLAADPDPAVRRAVAGNAATPPQAGLLLAADAEAAVRSVLARRVAALAPRLDAAAQDRLTRISTGTLAMLAADTAVEVRAAIAEVLAELPDAPHRLVLSFAADAAAEVAEPVIRLSPLLTEADLLALIAAPPAPFTRRAVAARPGLSEAVSDAVAGSADTPAIAALLANPSAAIREATLDRLAQGSAPHEGWQRALVARPSLPPLTQRTLGGILAAHLLDLLARRADLTPELAETLRIRIAERLDAQAGLVARETPLLLAARTGDRALLRMALAQDAGTSEARVDAAVALRSPRALAALCHRAGWSASLAAAVQATLGRLAAEEVIRPNVEGGWALSEGDLAWQTELLEGLPG